MILWRLSIAALIASVVAITVMASITTSQRLAQRTEAFR